MASEGLQPDSIVYAFLGGQTAEAIAQAFPVLTLEQVYGAAGGPIASRSRDALRFARVLRAGEQALVLSMWLRLDGGVTATWMANAFQHWFDAWRICERLLKGRSFKALQAKRRRASGPTVH